MTKKDMIEIVCEHILHEHKSRKVFLSGFKPAEQCDCPVCVCARELLGIKDEAKED